MVVVVGAVVVVVDVVVGGAVVVVVGGAVTRVVVGLAVVDVVVVSGMVVVVVVTSWVVVVSGTVVVVGSASGSWPKPMACNIESMSRAGFTTERSGAGRKAPATPAIPVNANEAITITKVVFKDRRGASHGKTPKRPPTARSRRSLIFMKARTTAGSKVEPARFSISLRAAA